MRGRWLNLFELISEYSLYAMIFFIPFSKAGIEIFFGLALLGFLIKKTLNPDFEFLCNSLHFSLLLFLFISALSLLNSGIYLKNSLLSLFFKWGEYLALFIIVEDILYNPKRIRNAIVIFLAVGLLLGIDGIYQYFSGVDFLRHRNFVVVKEAYYGISASFNHFNDFGIYLVVILSLIVALLISKQIKVLYRCYLSAMGMLLLVCLFLTLSRGSWLGFICALILMMLLTYKFKELGFLLSAFLVIIILIPGLREKVIYTFYPGGDRDRFVVWKTAFAMIKDNPFLGKGIGTFMDNFHKYAFMLNPQYAHNCYLQIWAETGIFSLLAFLAFLGLLFLKGIKAFSKNRDFLLLGLLCGIFGFLVHSLFDTDLYSLQLATLFWFMAGLAIALTKLEKNTDAKITGH